MRIGDLLAVRRDGRLRKALLLGVDASRDYPYEVLMDGRPPEKAYVNRGDVVVRHGNVFDPAAPADAPRALMEAITR